MRRGIAILWLALVPVVAEAQTDAENSPHQNRGTLFAVADRAGGLKPRSEPGDDAAAFQPTLAAAPVPATVARRRGSMVGYIDDAAVGSKIRVRFEIGLHNHVPDRAEFFYAKCGCYQDLAKSLPAYDPAAPGPRPGAVNDLNFQQLYVFGEYAAGERFSLFAELPSRWIQPQSFLASGGGFANQAGPSDLRGGAKLALLAGSTYAVTAQVQGSFPTGQSSKGLGTNHASLQPALLFSQRASNGIAVEAEISDWHPLGGSAGLPTNSSDKFSGDVVFYGIGPSYEAYRGDHVRLAPVVELVGWHVVSGFQTATLSDASGTNIVNVKIGARAIWNGQNSVYVGYGHALTSASWYDDIVRFEYRYAF